jgi:hypothetical protein
MLRYLLFFLAIVVAIVLLTAFILGIPMPQVFQPGPGSTW